MKPKKKKKKKNKEQVTKFTKHNAVGGHATLPFQFQMEKGWRISGLVELHHLAQHCNYGIT